MKAKEKKPMALKKKKNMKKMWIIPEKIPLLWKTPIYLKRIVIVTKLNYSQFGQYPVS